MTQIRAARQSRLVIHSSKRKGSTLYKWSLRITCATAGRNYLGKTRKTAFIVDKNRKPNTKLGKTRKQRNTPEQINHSFFSVKTKENKQKSAKSTKWKIPMPRLKRLLYSVGFNCRVDSTRQHYDMVYFRCLTNRSF